MQPQYNCLFCTASIGVDDVNPATDIALCRTCGKTMSLAAICGAGQIDISLLDNPPRWIRTEPQFDGGTKILYRRLSSSLLFLIPFTAVWSGVSLGGIFCADWSTGEEVRPLLAIPFIAGTVVLLSVIVYLLFGKWVVTLGGGQGTVFTGVGSLGWTRRFTYNPQTLVSFRTSRLAVNEVLQTAILVRTDGKDFMFGALLKQQAKNYVASAILREVSQVR